MNLAALRRIARQRIGLQARFLGASLLLIAISSAGYFIGLAELVEVVESELRDVTLAGELQEFVEDYRDDVRTPGPHAARLSSYKLRPGEDESRLPAPLRALAPGRHEHVVLDGVEVAVGRADVDGARLYVALDIDAVERLESRVSFIAAFCVVASFALAVLLALALARRMIRPVSRLAARVNQLQPGEAQRLGAEFDDPEIAPIAAAFDRFMERLEAFVAREQAFTEDASHELRTPLAVIDSAAQLLEQDAQLGAAARERTRRIRRAVDQMQKLIEALLFLAREPGGHSWEDVSLPGLAADVAEGGRELAAAKSLELTVLAAPESLRAPRGMLACVLGNLVLNAIHFTERGRVVVRLDATRLLVEDTGIGIAGEQYQHLFERGVRGAQSRGLGLGLYLVKRICDRLGWRVAIHSVAGTGTRVEVHFR